MDRELRESILATEIFSDPPMEEPQATPLQGKDVQLDLRQVDTVKHSAALQFLRFIRNGSKKEAPAAVPGFLHWLSSESSTAKCNSCKSRNEPG